MARPQDNSRLEEVLRLYRRGWGINKIAEATGLGNYRVHRMVTDVGVCRQRSGLPEETIQEIRLRAAAGWTTNRIAKDLGIGWSSAKHHSEAPKPCSNRDCDNQTTYAEPWCTDCVPCFD